MESYGVSSGTFLTDESAFSPSVFQSLTEQFHLFKMYATCKLRDSGNQLVYMVSRASRLGWFAAILFGQQRGWASGASEHGGVDRIRGVRGVAAATVVLNMVDFWLLSDYHTSILIHAPERCPPRISANENRYQSVIQHVPTRLRS